MSSHYLIRALCRFSQAAQAAFSRGKPIKGRGRGGGLGECYGNELFMITKLDVANSAVSPFQILHVFSL